jgi:allophanate hydrolase subunit 2
MIGAEPSTVGAMHAAQRWPSGMRPRYAATPTLHVLPGPHRDLFAPEALDLIQTAPFAVGASSNRTGYRLQGAQLQANAPDLPSLPVFPGVVQVPPDGAPILLMADAQPTGGYPIIAAVIAPDLPLAAQLLPGDTLSFMLIDQADACAAWHEMHSWLATEPIDDEAAELLSWTGA